MAIKKLAVRIACFLLVSGFLTVAPAQALDFQTGAARGFSLGNPMMGDLGGYYGGGAPREIDFGGLGVSVGKGLDLGCGGINIGSFIDIQFNMEDISQEMMQSMKTMVAKEILIRVLGAIPQLAAAQDFLQNLANERFKMFQANCDMGEIRAEAKKRYQEQCARDRQEGKISESEYVRCINMHDSVKADMAKMSKEISQFVCGFSQQPMQSMLPSLCQSSDQSVGCFIGSFLPEVCVENSACGRKVCVGSNQRRNPAITMSGVADAMMLYSDLMARKAGKVWDQIMMAPGINQATVKVIADEAYRMERADFAQNSGGAASNSVAATNLTMLPVQFAATGNDASQKLLEDYRKNSPMMSKCYGNSKMYDMLRYLKFTAKAANRQLGGTAQVDEDITISDAEKVPANRIFPDLPAVGSAQAQKMGLDPETVAIMLEETYGCLANTSYAMIANPAALGELALSPIQTSWQPHFSIVGKEISCQAVDNVSTFLLSYLGARELEIKSKDTIDATQSVKKDDGSTADKDNKVPSESVAKTVDSYFKQVTDSIKQQQEVNARLCARKTDFQSQILQVFNPSIRKNYQERMSY
ncbi:MAG: hypothetical protein H6922_05745 [Pseudomonadaceae bacterium]|nr:hypothetical protein [Pseudomonadaceae bacterium]